MYMLAPDNASVNEESLCPRAHVMDEMLLVWIEKHGEVLLMSN